MSRHDDERVEVCDSCGASYVGASAIRNYTRIIWTDEGLDTEEGFTVCRDVDCLETIRARIAEGTR